MIKISDQKPTCFDKLCEYFPETKNFWENHSLVITYAGVIHCKNPEKLTPDVIAHELVHIKQQESMPAVKFLEKFVFNKGFAKKMEIAAYKVQMAFIEATVEEDRELLRKRKFIFESIKALKNSYNISETEARDITKYYD